MIDFIRLIISFSLIFFVQCNIYALGNREYITEEPEQTSSINFELASGLVTDNTDIKQITAENELTIFFKPVDHSFIYLILFSPGQQVVWFYPPDKYIFDSDYYRQEHFFPGDNFWSKKREPGIYSLYLIVSRQPLPKLETLLWTPPLDLSATADYLRYMYTGFLLDSNNEQVPLYITGSIRNDQPAGDSLLIDKMLATPQASLKRELRRNAISFTGLTLYMQKFEIIYNEKK